MSANRKKALFIALGSLLASSAAVAVLTFHTDAGVDPDAATSGSAPHTLLPAQVAENVDVARHTDETLALFHRLSGESGHYSDTFSPPATGDEAPLAIDSNVDASSETYSARFDAVETTNSAAPAHFDDGFGTTEAILALNQRSFGGGYHLPGPRSPFQPGSPAPEDPLTDLDPLLPPDSSSNRPDPIFVGTGPGDGACAVFTGCGSPDDSPGAVPGSPGSVPGTDSPNEEPPVAILVPEPGSMGLLTFGLALAAFMGRRRRAPI